MTTASTSSWTAHRYSQNTKCIYTFAFSLHNDTHYSILVSQLPEKIITMLSVYRTCQNSTICLMALYPEKQTGLLPERNCQSDGSESPHRQHCIDHSINVHQDHFIHGSLGTTESSPKRHLDHFSHFCTSYPSAQHSHTDKQITTSVATTHSQHCLQCW